MAIDSVAKTLGRVAGKTNCAIETIHHTRKTGGAEITTEDGRGASAHIAAARSARALNPMTKEEGVQSGVGEEGDFTFARTTARRTSPRRPPRRLGTGSPTSRSATGMTMKSASRRSGSGRTPSTE